MMEPLSRDKPVNPCRDWFLVLLLFAELLLVTATWRLWFAADVFPVIPLFQHCGIVPAYIDPVLSVIFVISVAVWMWTLLFPVFAVSRCGRCSAYASWIALSCALALACLNQHRLQPWHWLFILVTAQAKLLAEPHQKWLRRLTVASIYVFAALSRLGPEIATGATRQVVAAACRQLGAVTLIQNESAVYRMCIVATLAELVMGMALLIPLTRRFAVAGAVLMHLVLLVLLSPAGLDHHLGVLIWNAFFVFGIPLLFLLRQTLVTDNQNADDDCNSSYSYWAAGVFAAFVMLFPLSGLFGIADNWLAWQVYSPGSDVVRVYVKESEVVALPADVQPFVRAPVLLDVWCPVRIDLWSLASVNVPQYPEDRFQLGIAYDLSRHLESDSVQVTIQSARTLFWQGRQVQELHGRDAILQAIECYLLNGAVVR